MQNEIIQALEHNRYKPLSRFLFSLFTIDELIHHPDDKTDFHIQVNFDNGIEINRADTGPILIPSDLCFEELISETEDIMDDNHDDLDFEEDPVTSFQNLIDHLVIGCVNCHTDYQRALQAVANAALDNFEEYAEYVAEEVETLLINPENYLKSFKVSVIPVKDYTEIRLDLNLYTDHILGQLELVKDMIFDIKDQIISKLKRYYHRIQSTDNPLILHSKTFNFLIKYTDIDPMGLELFVVWLIDNKISIEDVFEYTRTNQQLKPDVISSNHQKVIRALTELLDLFHNTTPSNIQETAPLS